MDNCYKPLGQAIALLFGGICVCKSVPFFLSNYLSGQWGVRACTQRKESFLAGG